MSEQPTTPQHEKTGPAQPEKAEAVAEQPNRLTPPTPDEVKGLIKAEKYILLSEVLKGSEGQERHFTYTRIQEEIAAGVLLAAPLEDQTDAGMNRKVADELILDTRSLKQLREQVGFEFRYAQMAEGKSVAFKVGDAKTHFEQIARTRIKKRSKPARSPQKAEKKGARAPQGE